MKNADQWLKDHRAQWSYQRLKEHLHPGESILNLGAGDCRLDILIKDGLGCPITPVDVEDHNETALPLTLYDGTHLPFADKSFDVVLLFWVLHHAADPSAVLGEARRVSRRVIIVFEDHIETYLDRLVFRAFHRFLLWSQKYSLPYREWKPAQWIEFAEPLGLRTMKKKIIGHQLGYFASCTIEFIWQPVAVRQKVDLQPLQLRSKVTAAQMSRAQWLHSAIKNEVPEGSTVLDLGAGNCIAAKLLQQSNQCKVACADVFDVNATDLPFAQLTGDTLPFPDKTFDTVIIASVLNHCANPEQLLKEAQRVSKSGRLLIVEDITENAMGRMVNSYIYFFRRVVFGAEMPHLFLNSKEWQAIFRACDCELEEERTLGQSAGIKTNMYKLVSKSVVEKFQFNRTTGLSGYEDQFNS